MSGAALMAFEIVAGFCVTYVAGAGVLGVLEVFDNSYSLTAKDPMYVFHRCVMHYSR